MSSAPPQLHYLCFDYSETEDGHSHWDALASVQPQRWPALLDEVEQLLRWCQAQAQPLPLDEGGLWDFDLQAQVEQSKQSLALHWDGEQLQGERKLAEASGWLSLALSLSCHESLATSLQAHWLAEDE